MKKRTLGYVCGVVGISLLSLNAGLPTADAAVTKTTDGHVAYVEGELELVGSDLPDDLDFGSHTIQYDTDKTYYATDSGTDNENATASDLTTGAVKVIDGRSAANKGWSVTVQQTAQFNDGTNDLASAELSAYGDPTTLSVSGSTDFISGKLTLTPGLDKKVMGATATETGSVGKGTTTLNLTHFTLDVPGASAKSVGTYDSEIVWTVSATPAT